VGGFGPAEVVYNTSNLTALGAGSCDGIADYITDAGLLTVPVGGSLNVDVATCVNTPAEPDELFQVTLLETSSGVIADSSAFGVIIGDPAQGDGYQVVVSATGTVALSWTATSGATTYQVYVGAGGTCTSFGPHGSPIPASQTSVTISLAGTHCIEVRDQLGQRAFITVGGTGVGGSISIGNTS
jgi:hypothetical protein